MLTPSAVTNKTSGVGARALARDVFFYDSRDPSATTLGGLVLTAGVTNSNFYSMLDILLVISTDYSLRNEDGETVPRDSQLLLEGSYAIVTDGTLDITDETPLHRAISLATGTRTKEFMEEVRQRDGGCVITKVKNTLARYGDWRSFEAAHIFPLAYEGHWIRNNYGRWITRPPIRGDTINSVQNGLLIRAHMYQRFDFYDFSINPDDNYKIICFQPDLDGIAGTYLDNNIFHDARQPAYELVKWHFRQAVLTNMKGAGEPIFEHDFPPGSDIMGDIRNGLKAGPRMEFELFGRFGAHTDLYS